MKEIDYRTFSLVQYHNNRLQIHLWQGRLFLVDSETGEKLNELINGFEGLSKYFHANYETWISKCLEKNFKSNLKQYSYYRERAREIYKRASYFAQLKGDVL